MRLLGATGQLVIAVAGVATANGALVALGVVGAVATLTLGSRTTTEKSSRKSVVRSVRSVIAAGVAFLILATLLSFGVIPGWRPAAVGGYVAGVGFIDLGRRSDP
jgi:hypothetical protein